jgi:hypothetical protein
VEFRHTNRAETISPQAKLLPLRLYVDQDALDFLKKFFAFKDPDSPSAPADAPSEETYIRTFLLRTLNG